jgi:hypothetical protein
MMRLLGVHSSRSASIFTTMVAVITCTGQRECCLPLHAFQWPAMLASNKDPIVANTMVVTTFAATPGQTRGGDECAAWAG